MQVTGTLALSLLEVCGYLYDGKKLYALEASSTSIHTSSPTPHPQVLARHLAIPPSSTVVATEQWSIFVPPCKAKSGLPEAMSQLSPPWKCYYKCSLLPSKVGNAAEQHNEQERMVYKVTQWHS